MLAQEFSLPDVLRIWDSLFSDCSRFDFLLYICCSMVMNQREKYALSYCRIFDQPFGDVLKLLQNFPPVDINDILSHAHELRRSSNKQALSSQIESLSINTENGFRKMFRHKKSPSNKT